MKTLPLDVSRCAGRYAFGDGLDDSPNNWCPERDTCARYQAFAKWDNEAGLHSYQRTSVLMAGWDCQHKIEASKWTD